MIRHLAKWLFPKMARDQRDKRMSNIVLTLFATLVVGIGVAVLIWLLNKR